MKLLLLAVGRLRPALREVCDDYLRRVSRFVTVDEREAREAGHLNGEDRRGEEDRRILRLVPERSEVILLDPEGEMWSSEHLALRLDGWRLDARDRTLVIGGAAGVGAAVRERAVQHWSLGPMTLPHEIARLVVAEQLYRAGTILQGTPYHRGGQ